MWTFSVHKETSRQMAASSIFSLVYEHSSIKANINSLWPINKQCYYHITERSCTRNITKFDGVH